MRNREPRDGRGSAMRYGVIWYKGPPKSVINCKAGWRTLFSNSSLCARNQSRSLLRLSRVKNRNSSGLKYEGMNNKVENACEKSKALSLRLAMFAGVRVEAGVAQAKPLDRPAFHDVR